MREKKMAEYSVVGKRLPRIDGVVKVTGEAKYAADLELPGMLYGKVLRAPYAHARILDIDTSKAQRVLGVKAVITGSDFKGFKYGFMPTTRDESPLTVDKVRYYQEGVAAVAAMDEDIAQEALSLIDVEYEELPGVFEPEEAIKEGAPLVHDDRPGNISWRFTMDYGDVEQGFKESDYIREHRFRTPRTTHGYLEPPAILAYYDPSGKITVWASKQSPYFIYRHLAAAFGLPQTKVRVVQPFIGGGFGGTKNDTGTNDFCAVLLSKITGKPVKIVYSQEEELLVSRRRHPMLMDMKMGVKRDGTLMAIASRLLADGGAYTFVGPLTMYLTGCMITLPYKLPHLKHEAIRTFTNNPVTGAMRGHGIAQTRYAAEILMDMIAEDLGIDPLDIRLKNAIEPGHETINGIKVGTCGFKQCLEKAAQAMNWRGKYGIRRGEGNIAHGIGLAGCSFLTGARLRAHNACAAIVQVREDGTVNYITGATDCGQGSDTVLSQIVAEELGIAYEDVEIGRVDTDFTPIDPGTYGSRVTYLAGNAAKRAAADAKRQLQGFAAEFWGVKPEDVELRERKVFAREAPEKAMSFRELARRAIYSAGGRAIIGHGSYSEGAFALDMEHGWGSPSATFTFCAQVAEVDVDTETGQVRVTDTIAVHDVGTAINPMAVEGQNEGGIVQGMGQALYEDLIMDKGKTLNPTFLDFKMARAPDVPPMRMLDVEIEDPSGPFGAKEGSEASITTTVPAIISAIHDATGVWVTELPVTPEKLLQALQEKGRVVPK
jgi:4-hydroxybenzoyl-CoA reductase subunit alpha